ncbi:unnamed protein product [Colias eurytheme]|nr:unnamed protein product [Colias eurytheme]
MGKTYSVEKKDEEIVIAQNGANHATASNTDFKLEVLSVTVTVMAVILFVLCAILIYKVCVIRARKMLRKELNCSQGTDLSVISQHRLPNVNVC